MKHYVNNPLLTMDNIILTLYYVDVGQEYAHAISIMKNDSLFQEYAPNEPSN